MIDDIREDKGTHSTPFGPSPEDNPPAGIPRHECEVGLAWEKRDADDLGLVPGENAVYERLGRILER